MSVKRRALIVGIDGYPKPYNTPTQGFVDAQRVSELFAKNENGSPNFSCGKYCDPDSPITAPELQQQLRLLWSSDADIALFYFSGHGYLDCTGKPYLQTTDREDAVSLSDLTEWANRGKPRDRVLILDTCHSGGAGSIGMFGSEVAILAEGVSILASSRQEQASAAHRSGSALTEILCDALQGGGTDTTGAVLLALVYSYADRVLTEAGQQPLLKCNIARSAELRYCHPRVDPVILRRLPDHFVTENGVVNLSTSHLPQNFGGDGSQYEQFRDLLACAYAHLVEPVGCDDLYDAAVQGKPCRLTGLGRKYWRYARAGNI